MDENKLNKVREEQEEPRKRVPLTRATFLAIMSMLMTVAVAASLTFALFVNDVKEQHVKIQAGELAIAVDYTKLEGKKIETNPQSPNYGRLVDFTSNASNNTEGVDFGDLDDTEENIFLIENAVPGLHQTATFEVYNKGNIAFKYEFKIQALAKAGNGTQEQYNALINQIEIRMTDGTNELKFMLADYANKSFDLGILNPTPAGVTATPATITVTATFLNDADTTNSLVVGDNAKAQNGGCTFDILIVATQTT